MRGYRVALLVLMLLPGMVMAQYWFQTGARGGQSSAFNSGARITIQTITGQSVSDGSIAFWVGETLQNGAFIQVGYLVPNQSGQYSSQCTASGCGQSQYLSKGAPEWFYEYFNPGNDSQFMGSVGTNDSAGLNSTFHTYGFYSIGDTWYLTMDNKTLGSINLRTTGSGQNGAVAFVEAANVSSDSGVIKPVIFSNLSIYRNGTWIAAPYGYAYSGYGVGSLSALPNPYGVEEIGNRADYFAAGSGLPTPNSGELLWQLGYDLNIISRYGNLSGTTPFIAYKTAPIQAPSQISIGNGTRAEFRGWSGYGISAYTGPAAAANVTLFGNVTEIANWQVQYLIDVLSGVGNTTGSGWYAANSSVRYFVNSNVVYAGASHRWVFENWSDGSANRSSVLVASGHRSVTANWQDQYLVNASSMYGSVHGGGWYANGSTARLGINGTYHQINATTRLAFFSWSDGQSSPNLTVKVTGPLDLGSVFRQQSLERIMGTDNIGAPINVTAFYAGNQSLGNSTFLFDGKVYGISAAYYKGTMLYVNRNISVSSPGTAYVSLPVYDLNIRTSDVFGIPVNASLELVFLNGTSRTLYSGSQGAITLQNVPYGAATIAADYAGETMDTSIRQSSGVRISFISVFDMEVFAAIALAGIVSYLLIARRLSHGIR